MYIDLNGICPEPLKEQLKEYNLDDSELTIYQNILDFVNSLYVINFITYEERVALLTRLFNNIKKFIVKSLLI